MQLATLQSRVCCSNRVVKKTATKLATCRGNTERPRKRPSRQFFCVTSVY